MPLLRCRFQIPILTIFLTFYLFCSLSLASSPSAADENPVSSDYPYKNSVHALKVAVVGDAARDLKDIAPSGRLEGSSSESTVGSNILITALALAVLVVLTVLLDRLWLKVRLKARVGELAARKRKLEALVTNAPVGIFTATPEGTFLEANRKLAEIHGFSSAEDLIRNVKHIGNEIFVRPEERLRMGEVLKRQGYVSDWEAESRRPDGTINWVSLSMRQLEDANGRLIREGFTVDITERKKAAQALEESRSRLALALEVAGAGAWDFYPRTGRTYFGLSWFTMLGYEPDSFEHTFQTWLELLHPDDRERAEKFMQNYLASRDRTSFSLQFRMRTGDGGWRWILGSGRALEWDSAGNPSHVIGINYDIQKIKDAERRLEASEKTYRELFNAGEDAIAVLRLEDKTFVDVNRAFVKLSGYGREELLDRNSQVLASLIKPDQGGEWSAILTGALAGTPQSFASVGRRKNGDRFFADVFVRQVNLNDIDRIMVVLHDVTEKRMMQEVMIQTEKMMSVGGLAAGMAHEINNPLNIILQGAQNVLRRTDPLVGKNRQVAKECQLSLKAFADYLEKRDIRQTVEAIRDAGLKAARTVENMLSFSRKSDSALVAHDLNRIVENTVFLVHNDFDLKKKYDFRHIRIEKDLTELPQVPCVETEIEQVLLNLLRNAGQAVAEMDNGSPLITLRTRRENDLAVIEVEDNGTGIHEDAEKRIFDPFFTTKETGVGTGLGLSVSYFIITRRHHGSIEMQSKPGEWTRFVIHLPLFLPR